MLAGELRVGRAGGVAIGAVASSTGGCGNLLTLVQVWLGRCCLRQHRAAQQRGAHEGTCTH